MRPGIPAIALLVLLTACQSQTLPETGQQQLPVEQIPWPDFDYSHAAAEGKRVLRLDPEKSQIDVIVRREGPLARLGHDHVVSVREADGFFLMAGKPDEKSRAELRFRADQLEVDATAARNQYMLDTGPDEQDIQATRQNLLTKVLEANQWPWLFITLSEFETDGELNTAMVEIAIRDSRINKRCAFRLEKSETGVLIEGSLKIRQTELGIEPFSVLGGGLRVADQLEIHFRLSGTSP